MMRLYIISACCIFIALFGFLSIRQDLWQTKELAIDDEQSGLNENVIINFSHVVAENTPKGVAAAKFAELVHEKSNGEIIVEIHPNGILYNDDTEVKALQNGSVQMIAPTFSKMTSHIPSWHILDLPFLFENDTQVYDGLTGPLSEKLLKDLEKIDIKGLTFWRNGFKQIATQKTPILEVEHFENVRIRTMASVVLHQQFQLLDALPITTTFNELYRSIEKKQVIAQENTISNLYSKGFYELQNEITLSNHGLLAYAVMMNEAFWNNLSSKHKRVIEQALQEMNKWQHESAIKMNEENLKKLQQKEHVNIYTLTDAQKQSWKEQLSPIYAIYNNSYYELLLKELQIQHD